MSADMQDLIERLERAAAQLEDLANREPGPDTYRTALETSRLMAKTEGVRLALSYAREYERGLGAVVSRYNEETQ